MRAGGENPDSRSGQVPRQASGKAHHGVLAGNVRGDLFGMGDQPPDGCEIQDEPLALGQHDRQNGLGQKHHAEEIDFENLPPGGFGGLQEGTVHAHPGIVDQNVDAAPAGRGFPDDGFAVMRAEKVGRDDKNFVGAGAGDFAEPVLAAGGQGYEGPLPGKSPGQTGSDARARAGDDDHLAIQSNHGKAPLFRHMNQLSHL